DGKSINGIVKIEQVGIQRRSLQAVDGYALPIPTAFVGALGPRMIDQDTPHRQRGGAEEMTVRTERFAAQTQPRFMHQRRGVERMAGMFASHLRRREFTQLVVDQR